MMKFQCKSCNAKLQADESKAGQVFPCPKCAEQVVVPSPVVEPDWFAPPKAPRTPPRSTENTTRHKVNPDVWDVCRMAVAHLAALLVFGIITKIYVDYRLNRVQANMLKQLEAIQKPFDPSGMTR